MQKTIRNSLRCFAPVTAALFMICLAGINEKRLSAAPAGGAGTFKARCAACHGGDGSGKTAMGRKLKLRDLRSADVQKQSDEDLQSVIVNGKPPMPAFGKILDAPKVQELVAYIRSVATK